MGLVNAPAQDAEEAQREPVRGLLLVYVVVLAALMLHGLFLTIGSIVVYLNPSAAGASPFPLAGLLLYVITNAVLILYTIVLFVLIAKRKRSAIAHNVAFNVLSVAFLLVWHVLGMKSAVGVVVDSIPNVLLLAFIVSSPQVKRTLVY